MSKHSPHPWTAFEKGPALGYVFDANGKTVATVPERDSEGPANLHLLAAAPDLLEACKDFAHGRKEARECESIMLAAIEKATRQTQKPPLSTIGRPGDGDHG